LEVKQYLIRATETEIIKSNIDAEVRFDVFCLPLGKQQDRTQ
jgi:hypothetical protein